MKTTLRPFLLAALATGLLAGCGGGGGKDESAKPATVRITGQPSSVAVDLGASAAFSVVATGSDLGYQWLRNGVAIEGATGATYAIPAVAAADLGAYTVRITGGRLAATSDPATLSLVGAPNIAVQPVPAQVTAGRPATFVVVATGDAPLAYQWRKDGVALAGATDATFTIPATATADLGTYSVVVSNAKGTTASNGVALTVVTPTPPSIVTPPAAQTVVQGTPASFSVVATGTDLRFQWTKDGAAIPGATGPAYTAATPDPSAAGAYAVVVSNDLGTETSAPATLTVVVPPAIATQPASQTANAGAAVSFSVVATGPDLRYQWTRDGAPIPGATSSTYTIPAATSSDAKAYRVVVGNAAASVTSDAATLTIRIPPTVTGGPTLVGSGASVSVVVTASGTAPLAYQWLRNGAPIDGANAATYVVGTVNASNSGLYSVVVSNAAGSVTSGTVAVVG